MRIRSLLLIHPKRSIRALITKYVYSELADIEIRESNGDPPVLDLIDSQAFDVIVTADRLDGMELTRLKASQTGSPTNCRTPLIVISDSESNHHRNALVERGFDRVVQIRKRPADLIRKINDVCNPRGWRRDDRFHLPDAKVSVHLADTSIDANLINLSRGGVLVELATDRPARLIQDPIAIDLQIPVASRMVTIGDLTCKLLRLEVVAWKEARTPRVMRTTFVFHDIAAAAAGKLEELIQMARADRLPNADI